MSPALARVGDVAASTRPRFNATRFLGLITVLSFGVSFNNILLGRRANLPRQQQSLESPVKRSERNVMPSRDDVDSQRVYDGAYITEILGGEKSFPKSNGRLRLKFRPGTLNMSSANALQHCFVNVSHYQGHIHSQRNQSLVSVSDEYKIIYRNVPKSSSSSARHAMKDFLGGGERAMRHDEMEDKVHKEGYRLISFVREPMNRFFSSYDEAFFRMGPWMGDERGSIARDKPRVRKQYHRIKYRVEKYPYLYEGFRQIEDFRRLYCPGEILDTRRFLDCNEIPSIDDGNLAHRFEQFVRDYSGLDPFDIHLNLQISNLVFSTGAPLPVTTLYNSSEAEIGWQEVAGQNGVKILDGEMKRGRKITRRFNVSRVSDAVKQKICRILVLDYCCLNIKLPEVCREGRAGEDQSVYCSMEQRNVKEMKFPLFPFVIQPWKDP